MKYLAFETDSAYQFEAWNEEVFSLEADHPERLPFHSEQWGKSNDFNLQAAAREFKLLCEEKIKQNASKRKEIKGVFD